MMKKLVENVAVSSDPLDYISSVFFFMKKFSHLKDKKEVKSTAYEALVRAHQRFIRENLTGDCRSYINEAIYNALLLLQNRIKRDAEVHKSLEEVLTNMDDDQPGPETGVLCEEKDYLDQLEYFLTLDRFVSTLDESDRIIFLFRKQHTHLTLAETAEQLAKEYPHLDIPCKQSGLTKRLQRINGLYHAYKERTGA